MAVTSEQMVEMIRAMGDAVNRLVAIQGQQAQQVPVHGTEAEVEGATLTSKKRFPISDRRGVTSIQLYSGKAAEYEAWKFSIKHYLNEEEEFGPFLRWIEVQTEPITKTMLVEWKGEDGFSAIWEMTKWMNHNLWQLLALKCVGDAQVLIRGLEDQVDTRGANAWRVIVHDHEGHNAQRMAGIVMRVFEPEKAKKYSDVIMAMQVWEQRKKEYVTITKGELHDSVLIHSIKKIVPNELAKDIQRMGYTKFDDAKKYVMDQVASRREPWFEGENRKKENDGVVPMELDMAAATDMLKELYEMRANGEGECEEGDPERREEAKQKFDNTLMALKGHFEGKGGGKGKGRFPGNCHHCGKPGHRISECRLKDEEMRKMRGEGKGQYQGGKGGGGKGYGATWNHWNNSNYNNWGHKGAGKGEYHKGKGKGGYKGGGPRLYWFDGSAEVEDQGGWQQQGQQGGWQQPRQLFNMTNSIPRPPGLMTHNMFGDLQGQGAEEEELEIPEAEEEGYQPNCLFMNTFPKTAKKANMKHVPKKNWKKVGQGHVMPLIAEQGCIQAGCSQVHAVSDSSWLQVDPVTKWRRVRSVMDSGASDSCAPPTLAPEVPIAESAGSRRGQTYAAAGGKSLDNLGEKRVPMMTNGGGATDGTWQMVEVVRPLNSVRQVCKQGNRVVFGMNGGEIQNIYTGEVTPFEVEGDIYTLDLWLPPEGQVTTAGTCMPCGNSPGFAGQGWSP